MVKRCVGLIALCGVAAALPAAPRWSEVLSQPDAWYASTEALTIGAAVRAHQAPIGGWPKNTDLTVPPAAPVPNQEATIDNGGTTRPLWFLARLVASREGQDAGAPSVVDELDATRQAVARGLDYLFAAQYANGGWPQFFPLRKGYYSHITYNDHAMIGVLQVLRTVADGTAPFTFIDPARRARAKEAVARGVACILHTQVRVEGQLTAWCAQHDAATLEPAPARTFEPVSLSGSESVGVLEFLMSLPEPSADVIAAVEAGVRWFEAVKIEGWRLVREPVAPGERRLDQTIVADPTAPPLWARFYEIGTNRPIFLGRDGRVRYDLAEVELERRSGYAYYGGWARSLLEKTYPQWRARLALD